MVFIDTQIKVFNHHHAQYVSYNSTSQIFNRFQNEQHSFWELSHKYYQTRQKNTFFTHNIIKQQTQFKKQELKAIEHSKSYLESNKEELTHESYNILLLQKQKQKKYIQININQINLIKQKSNKFKQIIKNKIKNQVKKNNQKKINIQIKITIKINKSKSQL
ncbi:hypothetical protein TTHERM_000998881 (macronuclear) [Tetrahymena thermophila SB210]|uniref:Uncharacterized protein n=1 Tax=Tetrahymena thermophila (strain SB210) TaxID=312017 RepID=W7XJ05_TETTS|nr:hypothetical protein TTHERM_000998881 [Tetrahymena thermophila SB210]EWS73764.1 hypothetical protein TTHERM_000998881 [Tetrahymena thermophila SB210]|eukprot:XP_012653695.1 hypothetical protein TTHERM_000998881 [Tetrahymena thermophila SB210]